MTIVEPLTSKPASLTSVEWLFGEFAPIYGARLADMWRGQNIKEVKQKWASELSGFRMGEVKAGLAACRAKPWPPTLPEFLIMCRPPADVEAMFIDAQLQISKRGFGEDVWPNRAAYWAAVEYGFFQLRNDSWQVAKNRWTRILIEQLAKEGELPDVPDAAPALPAPGRSETDAETARSRLADVKAILKTGKGK